jgi:hypothetical protein
MEPYTQVQKRQEEREKFKLVDKTCKYCGVYGIVSSDYSCNLDMYYRDCAGKCSQYKPKIEDTDHIEKHPLFIFGVIAFIIIILFIIWG